MKRLATFPETELVPPPSSSPFGLVEARLCLRRVRCLFTQAGSRRLSRDAWFSPSTLARLVPDLTQRVVYVCGPVATMAAVIRSMGALGVPPDQIRTEVFRLQ